MSLAQNTSVRIDTPQPARVRASDGSDTADSRMNITTTWTILRFTYGIVPIVAGLDKFTNLLVNWETYLNPLVLRVLPLSGSSFMSIVGVVEIAAGILTLARPRIGGFVVMAWLICIALSLIAGGQSLDVAVRDLVMAVGALTLSNLTAALAATNSGRTT